MSYKILQILPFEKQFKRLAKKYPSLKEDILHLSSSLKENPKQGESLGNNCFKVRLAIKSKKKGKSGGARLITNILIANKEIYLLSIYDKSEEATISNEKIKELLKHIPK